MKKESTILTKENFYEVKNIINNTAYLKSTSGKSGLLNIKTRQLIGNLNFYYTYVDLDNKFYFQDLIVHENNSDYSNDKKSIIRIYDALKEEIIVDGWEIENRSSNYDNYNLIAIKSPIDEKIHLFDKNTFRKDINIFYRPFDDVNLLYKSYNDIFLVLSNGGKKGLYYSNSYYRKSSLITSIEYDSIEQISNIFIFQKDNQKFFMYIDDFDSKSNDFDEILFDKNRDFLHCKKDNEIFVFNIKSKSLLLKVEADQVNFLLNCYNKCTDVTYFEYIKKDKHGIISAYLYPDDMNFDDKKYLEGIKILDTEYDEIKRIQGGFVIKQNEKYGLFIFNEVDSQFIKPKYDRIDYLNRKYYALYTNDYCDICEVLPDKTFTPIITKCKIVHAENGSYVYKKNKYGILFADNWNDEILLPEYDGYKYLKEYSYILEKNSKFGVFCLNKEKIPIEYDEISIGIPYGKNCINNSSTLFLSLKLDDKYKLAKLNHYNDIKYINTFDSVEFFQEIILLKDKKYSYMFSYDEDSSLIKKLDVETVINVYDSPYHNDFYDIRGYKKQLYCINGKNYYIHDNKLVDVFVFDDNIYVTRYSTDNGIYEVSGYDQLDYNQFCSDIDHKNQDDVEKLLFEMTEKGLTKKKYPSLILKKIIN